MPEPQRSQLETSAEDGTTGQDSDTTVVEEDSAGVEPPAAVLSTSGPSGPDESWVESLSPARVYLLIAIPFGLLFLLFIPPSQVLDESAHWFRVWQITDGHLVAEVESTPGGLEVNAGTYPSCVRDYVDQFSEIATRPESFSVEDYWDEAADCEGTSERVVGEAMGSYSFWSYPGHMTGLGLGRLLRLPLPWQFYLGRLGGLAVSIALVWYAIARAPRGQYAMAFVALLPMTLMGASGYSPDGLVFGTSLVLVSTALRYSSPGPVMARRDLAVVFVALTALSITKPPFWLFALLLLCVDPTTLGSKRRTRALLGAVAALALLLTGLWNRFGFPQGAIEAYRPGIDQSGQVTWIMTHPVEYANVLVDTFLGWESQEFVIRGWVGAFGMFRTGSQDSPLVIPVLVVVAAIGLTWFTSVECGRRFERRALVEELRTFVPVVLLVAMVLALYTAAYVAWDSVGAARIYGVQGRYFIPLLALPAAMFALRHERAREPRAVSLLPLSLVLLVGSMIKIESYFY